MCCWYPRLLFVRAYETREVTDVSYHAHATSRPMRGTDKALARGFRTMAAFGTAAAVIGLSYSPALAAPAGNARHASATEQAALREQTAALERPAASKKVAFSGHYSGTVDLLINNGSVTISSVRGKGTATLVGASSILGTGSASASAQCDPFGGLGSISGKTGTIKLSVASSTSQGCSSGESGPVTITFHGTAKATGGTGEASGATGTLKFNGTTKLGGTSGRQNGSFSATISGELAVRS